MTKLTIILIINIIIQNSEHPTIKAMAEKNNSLRKQLNCTHQTTSTALTKAAQNHAWYMAKQHDKDEEDFEHCGNNGTPGERSSKYGYVGSVIENIARGYCSIDKLFIAWHNSAAHCKALYSDTNEVGFGYALAKDGTTYWVVLYGKTKREK